MVRFILTLIGNDFFFDKLIGNDRIWEFTLIRRIKYEHKECWINSPIRPFKENFLVIFLFYNQRKEDKIK